MNNSRDNRLHIVGKVAPSVIKKMEGAQKPSSGTIWLFVGYCFQEFGAGSLFDIVLEEATQNWNHDYQIRLSAIYDESGISHSSIPAGYKTICSFECKPTIPVLLKNLPVLKTWQFAKPGVYLCNHETIKLFPSPLQNHLLFDAVTRLLLDDLHRRKKKQFSMEEVSKILPKESSDLIIDNLLLTGQLKKGKREDELILVD